MHAQSQCDIYSTCGWFCSTSNYTQTNSHIITHMKTNRNFHSVHIDVNAWCSLRLSVQRFAKQCFLLYCNEFELHCNWYRGRPVVRACYGYKTLSILEVQTANYTTIRSSTKKWLNIRPCKISLAENRISVKSHPKKVWVKADKVCKLLPMLCICIKSLLPTFILLTL